eukprot:scaffold137617_cov35-Attheya_sp.AAC.1
MTSCLTGHSRYTVDSVRIASTSISPNFDRYDIENDKAATLYVLDSGDATLHCKITNRLKDVDSFP